MGLKALQGEEFISKKEIAAVLAMRESRNKIKKQLELIDCSLKETELGIIKKIDDGAIIDAPYSVAIKEKERRFPAWKEHFISIAGKEAAERVISSTVAKIYRELVIRIG